MKEYTNGVVEEYIAHSRRTLNSLLDRGLFTPEGIEDHIQHLRESIEEDLDDNKAYALLNLHTKRLPLIFMPGLFRRSISEAELYATQGITLVDKFGE